MPSKSSAPKKHLSEDAKELPHGNNKKICKRSLNIEKLPDDYDPIGQPIILVGLPIVITFIVVCVFLSMDCSLDPEICYKGTLRHTIPFISVESDDQSFGTKTTNALMTALCVVGVVAVGTFVMVFVFYLNLTWCMIGYVLISITIIIIRFTLIMFKIIVSALNVAFDWYTAGLIVWNLTGTFLVIFYMVDSPKLLRQMYLIFIASSVSLHFITLLPPITTWLVLGALVLWDLFAVIAPCGPLRCIIELIQKREEKDEPVMKLPEVMLYATMLYWINMSAHKDNNKKDKHEDEPEDNPKAKAADKPKDNKLKNKQKNKQMKKHKNKHKDRPNKDKSMDGHKDKEESKNGGRYDNLAEFRPQLGMGDFIFYSLLVGKTWIMSHQLLTVLFVSLSILMGLFFTLLLLLIRKEALPALPISLTLALMVLFVCQYFVEPFVNKLNVHMIYI